MNMGTSNYVHMSFFGDELSVPADKGTHHLLRDWYWYVHLSIYVQCDKKPADEVVPSGSRSCLHQLLIVQKVL
jgi:hypothetical protein